MGDFYITEVSIQGYIQSFHLQISKVNLFILDYNSGLSIILIVNTDIWGKSSQQLNVLRRGTGIVGFREHSIVT